MRSCFFFFFFSSRRRHTRLQGDWSSDVCSSDLAEGEGCSDAVSPVGEMQRPAETYEPAFAGREDQKIDKLVEEIEAVRDASQVDDWCRQVFRRKAEHAEEEKQRSR